VGGGGLACALLGGLHVGLKVALQHLRAGPGGRGGPVEPPGSGAAPSGCGGVRGGGTKAHARPPRPTLTTKGNTVSLDAMSADRNARRQLPACCVQGRGSAAACARAVGCPSKDSQPANAGAAQSQPATCYRFLELGDVFAHKLHHQARQLGLRATEAEGRARRHGASALALAGLRPGASALRLAPLPDCRPHIQPAAVPPACNPQSGRCSRLPRRV
jgi:hypothetical protein